jgi:hypothetical protein
MTREPEVPSKRVIDALRTLPDSASAARVWSQVSFSMTARIIRTTASWATTTTRSPS